MISNLPGSGMPGCPKRFIWQSLVSGLLTIGLIFSGTVQAEEKRHHGAHVHGVASLNVAVEGNNVYMEFSSPAANIVGFEHQPRTQAQKDAVADAVGKLQAGETLFIFTAGAESQLVNANVHTDIYKGEDHHSGSEHAHAEEGHASQEEHHDEAHGEADEHERHSDVKAQYHFVCQKPDKLSQIDVQLFRDFPGIEHIEVQLLTETKQTAVALTAKKNRISF
jgi:hypothetical protein